ncbi:adenylate/guanylate cyclase domain protein (macronuclear) [Tetrahymena thermophila SB210]|uniref:adenylate cyclase n=1 Tax=Tetrahymena thermophila (strain SB210) TaxID=312017 RepID=W7XKQ6_TETTS|nr:adenylate/guanylate cyclase domain protein [Tetrahymena thermophila SB210]EWS76726.1 adenylate/guanylate cyclase domain protein [Tetrahymena thermophila SB210]|eukprot:XP_012650719.1 adenylate/guanylate cyclase domain protein [Tetrahymena thermophila SB210]
MQNRQTFQNQIMQSFKQSKKKKEKEEKEDENQRVYSRKLELVNGELFGKIQVISDKICTTNKISFFKKDRYVIFNFLLMLSKNYFYRFGNTACIVIVFIFLGTPVKNMIKSRLTYEINDYIYFYLLQSVIGFIVLLIRDLYIITNLQGLLSQINQSQYTLFQKFNDDKIQQLIKSSRDDEDDQYKQKIATYTSSEVSNIQIGDIVLLKKGDICPADCLILDMKEQFCSVKNNVCSESNQFDIKRAPQVTQILSTSKIKGFHFEYRKILNGIVEFVSSTENETQFEGYIKLNKDPNGENLNDQNMIFRGQELMYTEWCVALVLYVGYECRFFKIYSEERKKIKFAKGNLSNKIEKFFLFTFLFIILFTLASSIIDYTQPFNSKFNSTQIDQNTGQVAATYFIEYIIFLPIVLYPFYDIMHLTYLYMKKRVFENPFQFFPCQLDIKKDEDQNNEDLQEINLQESAFTPIDDIQDSEMCLSTHAVFSKSGTLTHNEEFQLASITIGNKMYKLNIETLTNVINHIAAAKPSLQYVQENKVPSYEAIDIDEGTINNSPDRKNVCTRKQNLEKMQANDFDLMMLRNVFVQNVQNQTLNTQSTQQQNEETINTNEAREQKYKKEYLDTASPLNGNGSLEKNTQINQQIDASPILHHRSDIGRMFSSPKSNISGDFLNEPDYINLRGQTISENQSMESSPADVHHKFENVLVRQKNESCSMSQSGIHLDISNFTGGIEKFYKNTQQNSQFTIEGLLDSQAPLDFSSSINNSKIGQNSFEKNDIEFIQEERDFLKDLLKNDQSFANAIKAISVSHMTKTKFQQTQLQFFQETINPLDKLIQDFTSQIGYQFRCSNKINDGGKDKFQYIFTNYQNETKKYTLLLPPAYNERKTRFCIILKEDDSKRYTLYLKEELVNYPSYMMVDKGINRQDQEKRLRRLIEQGQIPIAFCKRELDELEIYQIQNQYENALKAPEFYQNKEAIINYIYSSYIFKLELQCIIGIQETLRKDSQELVSLMNESFINTWMLTGDQFQKAVPAAYNCRILQRESTQQTLIFDCNSYKNLKALIKNYIIILKQKYLGETPQINKNQNDFQIQNSLKRKKTSFTNYEKEDNNKIFNIIISGKTFEIIQKNQYLNDHFTFLLFFTKNLVGYQFDQFQKAQILQNLKKCQPKSKILGIGNGLSDLRMYAQCDYSIEVVDFQKREIYARANSIVRSMKDIIKQLAINSKINYLFREDLIIIIFKKCFLLGLLMFFWNSYQSSYGIQLFDQIYLFQNIYYTPMAIFLLLMLKMYKWQQPFKKEIIDKVQTIIYIIHNKSAKRDNIIQYIKTVFLQGTIDGLLLFLVNIFQYQRSFISNNGQVLDQKFLDYFLYQNFHAFLIYKYLSYRKLNWKIWIIAIISICLIQVNRIWDKDIQAQSFVVVNMTQVCQGFLTISINLFTLNFYPLFQTKISKQSKKFYELFEILKNLLLEKPIKKFNLHMTKVIRNVFKDREKERALEELITDDATISQSKTNPFTLKFLQKETETKYIQMISQRDKRFMQIYIILQILLQYICQALMYSYELQDNHTFNSFSICSAILAITWFITLTSIYSKYFLQINNFIIFIKVLCNLDLILSGKYVQNSLQEIINHLIISQQSYVNPIYYIAAIMTTTLTFIFAFFKKYNQFEYFNEQNLETSYFITQTNQYIQSTVLVFQVLIVILIIKNKYRFDHLQRLHFQKLNHLSYETKKIQGVLSILMPKFIRDKIDKNGEVQLQEDQGEVSILFCDICDFEQILSAEQENIVRLVDKLFRSFDSLCNHAGLQKIETVGKTYMAAGGLKDSENKKSQYKQINPVARAVIMSFEMMDIIKQFNYGDNEKVKIKIGIHYGRVIAGVIGCHKPQFSLIGDTVNTASRVCSTGDVGQITLSEQAYDEIKQIPYIIFQKKRVYAKGKGDINTYQVMKRQKQKNQNSNEIPLRDQVIQRVSQKKNSEKGFINQLSEMSNKNMRKNKTTILKQRKILNEYHSQENIEYFNSFNFQLNSPTKLSENKKYNIKIPDQLTANRQQQQEEGGTTNFEEMSSYKFAIQSNNLHTINGFAQSQKSSNNNILSKPFLSNGALTKAFSSKVLGNQGEAIQEADEEEDKKIEAHKKSQEQFIEERKKSEISQNLQDQQRKITTSLNYQINNRNYNSPSIENKNNIEQSTIKEKVDIYTKLDCQNKETVDEDICQQILRKQSKFKNEYEQTPQSETNTLKNHNLQTYELISPIEAQKTVTIDEQAVTQENQIEQYDLNNLKRQDRKSKRYLSKELSKMWNQKIDNPESSTIIIQPIKALEQELGTDLKIDIIQEVKEAEVEIEKLDELFVEEKILNKKLGKKNHSEHSYQYNEFLKIDDYFLKVFLQHQIHINSNVLKRTLILSIMMAIFKSVCIILVLHDFTDFLYFCIILYGVSITICLAMLIIQKKKIFKINGYKISIILSFIYYIQSASVFIEILLMKLNDQETEQYPPYIHVLTLPLIYLFILFLRVCMFTPRTMIFKAVFQIIVWNIVANKVCKMTIHLEYLVLFTIFIQLIIQINNFYLEISQFQYQQTLESRAKKQNDILMYLLPEHILSKFLNNPNKKIDLIDQLDNVTFLFADIAGFTKYSGSVQPENVVNMLRILFNEFDQQCQKKNLYKIYTIGDCYVVIGTKNASNRLRPHEEAKNVVELGFEMIEIIKKVRSIVQFEELEMRIGVHTGSYIGGVIGTDIVRYDIYGPDVMIANKMESNGEQGKVMVSKTTMNLLYDHYGSRYNFTKGNEVYIKQFHKHIEGYFIEQNII